ncbi:hypothetical protein BS17DRAFT_804219 [Gyrodon lividus]|nr:hypothetical protein BS17DRAFT_804219 [Gyrodon lividus]
MSSQEAQRTIKEHISNEVPTHLIDVRTMRLVGREDVARFYQSLDYVEVAERFNRGWVADRPRADVVRYAILSHRWLDQGEPTYQQMMAKTKKRGRGDTGTPSGPGYQKLVSFCQKAIEYDCPFAWSNTCCIDKTSSAELDEAIRSMFRWYRNSTIWWTLQELLAPLHIKFYNRNWEDLLPGYLNDKWCLQLTGSLSTVTDIPREDIENFKPKCNRVAEKIRWTSGRATTKLEDAA